MEYLDVTENPKLLPGMLKHSGGQRRVPVIVEDGKATIGYGGT